MKHTPGPWKVKIKNGGCREIESGDVCVAIPHGPAGVQSEVYDEHRANAHLIAASPDLFNICKMIREIDDQGQQAEDGEFYPLLTPSYRDMLDAAIEKAEGHGNTS
jgi:hypothetical protein